MTSSFPVCHPVPRLGKEHGGGQEHCLDSHPATEARLSLPTQFGAVLSNTGLFWGEGEFGKLRLRSEARSNGLLNDLEPFPGLSFPI